MRSSCFALFTLLLFSPVASVRAEAPLLYLPFDGNLQAAVSGGAGVARQADEHMRFHPGLRGSAVFLAGDLRWCTPGCFNRASGTIAFWLRPDWSGTDKARTLFSLYGGRELRQPWLCNRYSITAGRGQLTFWIAGARADQRLTLHGPIAAWQPGTWRHVAVCWSGVNSGRPDACGRLYLDGQCVDRKSGMRIDVGPVADTLDIGRDSDQSPQHADADYDEFYIYGRALSAADVRRAVELARQADATIPRPVPAGRPRDDWWNDAWPLRSRVTVVPRDSTDARTVYRLPLDLQSDIAALGVLGPVDPASLRIVPCDPQTGRCRPTAQPLAAMIESDAVSWQLPGVAKPRQPLLFEVYFDVAELDTAAPLWVNVRRRAWTKPESARFVAPDYARDTYGKPWDFNRDGDFEGIDGWGNRPEYIRNRQVKNGVMSFDVSEDPYFIWGNMWSDKGKTRRPVAIDLGKYPLLKMRVRQSCPTAVWQLYGRAGSPQLMNYKFPVTGTAWQTIRIDLERTARWGGVLQALRIDPTWRVADAHVEIDWIQLTNELLAQRAPVEILGRPDRAVAALAMAAQRSQIACAAEQTVTVRVRDASGAAVAGQPVTVRLATNRDGQLLAHEASRSLPIDRCERRGITDREGQLRVVLQASRRAGPTADVLHAAADFTGIEAPSVAVAALAGPPHHYQFEPRRGCTVAPSRFPLSLAVQMVDEYGNPLAVAGRRVRLSAAAGATLDPSQVTTDAQGRATASLSVDPDRHWVYVVEAIDAEGLSGRSGAINLALEKPRTAPIRLGPSGYFATAAGRPFIPLGGFYANMVHVETPDGEWSVQKSFPDATDDEMCRWMRFLHHNGVTAMRLMLRAHRDHGMEPMDLGGWVNQSLLAQTLHYMDLARRFDLKFQLVLHEDYDKPVYHNEEALRRFSLPDLDGNFSGLAPEQLRFLRDLRLIAPAGLRYTDRDAIACQDRYIRELLPALRNCPQLFAYELENEMVACPASWAAHAVETIRREDRQTPICVSHGGGGVNTADPLWWHRKTPIDFYNYHLYPHDGTTSPDLDYGAAVDLLARYGRMAGPSLLGESSGDQFVKHPSVAQRRRVMRDIIWFALTKGNPGVFFWNARGPEVREFGPAAKVMAQIDWTRFRRAEPAIGIDVCHPLDDDLWFRSPRGRADQQMMGRYTQYYLSAGVDFDFTLTPDKYAFRADLQRFAPAAPPQRRFDLAPGWQLSYLAGANYDELLVYVRNYAGAELWTCNFDRAVWKQYLRRCRTEPLRIGWDLPGPSYRIQLYDLETQAVETRVAAASSSLDLGATDHDYVLLFQRQ